MKLRLLGIAAALASFAAPASAAAILGATKIRVTNTNNTWLQIAELQAFTFGAVNVAAALNGATATGSIPGYDSYATPDKAIDGDLGGNYYTDQIFHPITEAGTFFQVAFAGPATIGSLKIFGRTDCCNNRDIYDIQVLGANDAVLRTVNGVDATSGSATVVFGAVPEPTTWAMMIAGFGLVGGAVRYRRRRTGFAVVSA